MEILAQLIFFLSNKTLQRALEVFVSYLTGPRLGSDKGGAEGTKFKEALTLRFVSCTCTNLKVNES